MEQALLFADCPSSPGPGALHRTALSSYSSNAPSVPSVGALLLLFLLTRNATPPSVTPSPKDLLIPRLSAPRSDLTP